MNPLPAQRRNRSRSYVRQVSGIACFGAYAGPAAALPRMSHRVLGVGASRRVRAFGDAPGDMTLAQWLGTPAPQAAGDSSAIPLGTNYNLFGASNSNPVDPVVLLDGSTIEKSDIQFNPDNYHFTQISTGADLTNNIAQKVKRALVPNFDVAIDDDRVYREGTIAAGNKDPGPPLPTGYGFIASQTVAGIAQDVAKVGGLPGLVSDAKSLILFAVIGLAIFYGLESR